MKKPAKAKPRRSKKSRRAAPPRGRAEQIVHRVAAAPASQRIAAATPRAVAAYSTDDRAALGLLLLPFMVLALGLGVSQTLKPADRWLPTVAAERPAIRTPGASRPTAVARLPEPAPASPLADPPVRPGLPPTALEPPRPVPPAAIELPGRMAAYPPAAPSIEIAAPVPGPALPERIAGWTPPAPPLVLERTPPVVPLPPPAAGTGDAGVCLPAAPLQVSRSRVAPRVALHRAASPDAFGRDLAAAARTQTDEFVIYTARYQHIAYPMGDLSTLHGACTDVVIRAYRSLGIDLQELVHHARAGGGDRNIDHRRTETLRRFFQRHGEMLALSPYPEDYKPGDIVTYYRPFSRVSRAHIAVVSDVIAPTGRPMIIHNRGYGPQLEDALFVDRITGHYRYSGPTSDLQVAATPRLPDKLGPLVKASAPAPKRQTAGVPVKVN